VNEGTDCEHPSFLAIPAMTREKDNHLYIQVLTQDEHNSEDKSVACEQLDVRVDDTA
jgi:hypothetical protein